VRLGPTPAWYEADGDAVTPDRSLRHYGSLYHRLLDPLLVETRRAAVELVPARSSVLDIGGGTGQLCFDLCKQKHCRVVGVDLSLRMLDFARAADAHPEVGLLHLDAGDLVGIDERSFDVATILLLLHELPVEKRTRVLREARRVARAVLIIDAAAPLPWNPGGIGIRLAEYSFGHEHLPHFRDFLARGAIMGLLDESGDRSSVAQRRLFMGRSREVVVVQPQTSRGAGAS
jgi:SAM-dependent methyltransferase